MNSSQKERRCKANQRRGRCFKRLLLFRIVIQQKQLCFRFLNFQTGERHGEGFRGSHLLCTLCAERGDRGAADGNQCRASLRIRESQVKALRTTQVTYIHSETACVSAYVNTQRSRCRASSAFHRIKESQKQSRSSIHKWKRY